MKAETKLHLANESDLPEGIAGGAISWAMRKVCPDLFATTAFYLGKPEPDKTYHGCAYCEFRGPKVPAGLDYRIDIHVSPDERLYPTITGVLTDAMFEGSPDEARRFANYHRSLGTQCVVVHHDLWSLVFRMHGYGGKTAPISVLTHWIECVVYVAAHEAQHLRQITHGRPLSEVECERIACQTLRMFRLSFDIPEPSAATCEIRTKEAA